MMTRGIFGRGFFNNDTIKDFREKWSKMTDEEKLELMNKKMQRLDEIVDENGNFDSKKMIAGIDARCEDWMKKTAEEKEELIKQRMEHMKDRGLGHGHCGGERGGFDFFQREI